MVIGLGHKYRLVFYSFKYFASFLFLLILAKAFFSLEMMKMLPEELAVMIIQLLQLQDRLKRYCQSFLRGLKSIYEKFNSFLAKYIESNLTHWCRHR